MRTPRRVAWLLPAVLLMAGANAACGQAFPAKPIRIVATEAGGGTDFASRIIARGLTSGLGRQVIVENRAAIVAPETVAKSPPDGYTLLGTANSAWLLPFLRKNVAWDPVRDFSPITLAVMSPNMVAVHSLAAGPERARANSARQGAAGTAQLWLGDGQSDAPVGGTVARPWRESTSCTSPIAATGRR